MLSRTLALTACATLLIAAGAAQSQTLVAPFGGRNAGPFGDSGLSDRFNRDGRGGRHSSPYRWRHQHSGLGGFYGAGLPFYPYDGASQDAGPPSPVILPQPPAPGPAQVDVRVHPTYSELPYYARTAGPSLQRVVKTRRGVRVVTTTFEPPITRDVPLTAQP